MRTKLAALVFALLAVSSSALADSNKSCSAQWKSNKAICELSIDVDEAFGDKIIPLGEISQARRDLKFKSLVRLRTDYIDKITQSAEDM